MIQELKLVNFRSFSELQLQNLEAQNFLVWENGRWKTNILESISILCNNSLTWLSLDDLIKQWEDYFFIEYITDSWDKVSFSYIIEKKQDDSITKKRIYKYNNNKISKQKFHDITYKCVVFSPIFMNIMYLSPSLRRDFLDNILKSSFSGYEKLMSEYKKILKSRNQILKNIHNSKSSQDEIKFWDEKFITYCVEIYKYRFKLINFFKESIHTTKQYFWWKIEKIEFKYLTKVEEDNIKQSIKNYLSKNLSRDIILGRTSIWPHVDDFEILTDDILLSHFASRWEAKSIILWLKLLEWIFVEKMTGKKPVLLIDDLLSELDENHKNMLLEKIEYYQAFISSITKINDRNFITI